MNIRNFRDISGYRNRNGKVMKKNMIFRGGALNHMTKSRRIILKMYWGLGIFWTSAMREKRKWRRIIRFPLQPMSGLAH